MRILLDSIYLFPLIGVRVSGLDPLLLLRLKPRHRLLVSDVSLFELSAKGAKYVVQDVLDPEDVTRGIQSLSMDADIARIPYFTTRILNVSFRLQRNLGDFIDCLILSTAINESDVLMTEDDIILNFTDDEANRAFLHALNPDFRILDHTQQESLGLP